MEGQLTTHWVQHRGYNIVVDEPLLRIVVCDVRQRLFWAVSQIEFSRHFNSDTGRFKIQDASMMLLAGCMDTGGCFLRTPEYL